MLSSSVRAVKQVKKFVKLRRFKVSTLQIQQIIREERLSGKNDVVKVCNFSGATIEDMQHNLVLILERNACRLILHVGTNNAESCTSREILDKLLKLKPSFQPQQYVWIKLRQT